MTESKARKVELFDTSLRDGLQQPNLEISVPNAVMLLQRMGSFGVRYAEIGFAGSNQFVTDLTGALASVETGAMQLALFGRTRGRGTKVQEWPDVQFIVANKKRVSVAVVVVKSRLLDITKSLETTPEENLLMVSETIQCLHDNGLEVFVDFRTRHGCRLRPPRKRQPLRRRSEKAQPRLLPPDRRAMRRPEGQPPGCLRHHRRRQP